MQCVRPSFSSLEQFVADLCNNLASATSMRQSGQRKTAIGKTNTNRMVFKSSIR